MCRKTVCLFRKLIVSLMLAGFSIAHAAPSETPSPPPKVSTESTGSTGSTGSTEKATVKKENNKALLFQVFTDNQADEALINRLEEAQTFARISKMIETNFKLSPPVRVLIKHTKAAQFVATELEEASFIITLPFSFLHTLSQALNSRYEHQPEVINIIFSASIEFYVWSELANYLIEQKRLDVQGDRYMATDNFATIMMLNQNTPFSDYLADASEAYLLIHTNSGTRITPQPKNELEQDQQRYKQIICLTIGFDQLQDSPDTEQDHLNSFYWDEEKIAQCKSNYTTILNNWFQALRPALKKKNLISHWLHN